jgi:membrane protease YdiL (CAAX protease family)
MGSGLQMPGGQISEKARNSPALALIFLLWACLLGMLLGNLLVLSLASLIGADMALLQGMEVTGIGRSERDQMRAAMLVAHLCTFALPAVSIAQWLDGAGWKDGLALSRPPAWKAAAVGVIFICLSFPLSQYLYWWNLQLPLPEQLLEMERSANEVVKVFIQMDDLGELLLNLLTIGFVAAIGEELVFRGLVQPRLSKLLGSEIAGIWAGAVLFSAIHFQFAGFLPRMVLGATLGYLFFWTRNLWVPVTAHFFFNGAQIVVQYLFKDQMEALDPERMRQPHWAVGLLPLLGMILLAKYFKTHRTKDYGI